MNWLDLLILAILVVALLWGFKNSLLKVAFIALGVIIGWWLAGQYAGVVAEMIGNEIGARADTIVTTVSYSLIIGVAVVVAELAGRVIRPLIVVGTAGTAGMADKLGGMGLGLILGLAVSSALIIGMARLTYDFTLPDSDSMAADQTTGRLVPVVEGSKEWLEGALVESSVVGVFLQIRGVLPGGALGFVPHDFQVALDILEQTKKV